ncbi:hypothetical protein C2W64_03798 [Brevibacillus laterosporus]|nr:hypothetical protein C2W64_03798 [Brevibacillus laterosporus]
MPQGVTVKKKNKISVAKTSLIQKSSILTIGMLLFSSK